MGQVRDMYRVAKSHIKLGITEFVKDVSDYFIEAGTAGADPISIRLGVWIKTKEQAARDVLLDKDCLQYMDKEIRSMESNRIKRREYMTMTPEEQAKDSALYRHREWERLGLSDKRKEYGIDVMIDNVLAEKENVNKHKGVMGMGNDIQIPQFSKLYAEEIQQQKEALHEYSTRCADTGTMISSGKPMSNGWSLMDCGAFDEFQECSYSTYVQIAKACKAQGITHVYDIGCNTAWQGKVFKEVGIEYTGIEVDPHSAGLAPKEDGIEIVNKAYPYPIEAKDRAHTAAVSNLCVGFGLLEGNPEQYTDFTEKMYNRMAKDFDYFVGSAGPESQHVLKEKFGVLDMSVGQDNELIPVWGNRNRFYEFNQEAERQWNKRTERLFGVRIESLVAEANKENRSRVKPEREIKLKQEKIKTNSKLMPRPVLQKTREENERGSR